MLLEEKSPSLNNNPKILQLFGFVQFLFIYIFLVFQTLSETNNDNWQWDKLILSAEIAKP